VAGHDLVRKTLSLEMGKEALARCVEVALTHKLGLGAASSSGK
jgi:hypothetical protein